MPDEPPAGSATGLLVPPAQDRPSPGTYQAAERSILEISAMLGPLTMMRGRFAVLENSLVVAESPDRAATLLLEASVPSLRTTRPLAGRRLLGRRGLDAARNGLIRVEMERISTVGDAQRHIRARLHLRAAPIDISMKTRVVVRAEDRVALIATGAISSRTLRETCSVRLPRSVPADRVRLVLVADFR